MSKNVAVLTCDLKRSRSLSPEMRANVQEQIYRASHYLLNEFPYVTAQGFEFRFGDEWQVVIGDPSKAYTAYSYLYYLLPEIEFYCGIGIGEVSTPASRITHNMDGPAFHKARQALYVAKKENRSILLHVEQVPNTLDLQALIQTMADLVHRLRVGRRESQFIVAKEAILHGVSRNELAERLSLHRTTIYRREESSGVLEEMEAMRQIEGVLQIFNQ